MSDTQPTRRTRPLQDRFWAKVEKRGPDECWVWRGATNGRYGHISRGGRGGGHAYAHRLSYEWHVGPIPDGLTVDHLCDNPVCVNPAHLVVATQRDNNMRGQSAAAKNARKTHCPSGHPYDEENTYVDGRGNRHCRECMRARDRARAVRRRKP